MNARPLSPELTDALHAAASEPLPVVDPTNQQLYFVVDRDVHERAMRAFGRQDAIESIKRVLVVPYQPCATEPEALVSWLDVGNLRCGLHDLARPFLVVIVAPCGQAAWRRRTLLGLAI